MHLNGLPHREVDLQILHGIRTISHCVDEQANTRTTV